MRTGLVISVRFQMVPSGRNAEIIFYILIYQYNANESPFNLYPESAGPAQNSIA